MIMQIFFLFFVENYKNDDDCFSQGEPATDDSYKNASTKNYFNTTPSAFEEINEKFSSFLAVYEPSVYVQ